MLTRFYRSAVYIPLEYSPDLQAYRTDRFTGWTRQPANIGPVVFTNTSPTYFNLKPLKKQTSGFAPETGGRLVGGLMLLAAAGLLVRSRRARPAPADESATVRR
jgi:peptide/nickel transport system substrate-binding protein